jgi:hypothetical protein
MLAEKLQQVFIHILRPPAFGPRADLSRLCGFLVELVPLPLADLFL